jgi:hypothetical protein
MTKSKGVGRGFRGTPASVNSTATPTAPATPRPPAGSREETIWLGDQVVLKAKPEAVLGWLPERAKIQERIQTDKLAATEAALTEEVTTYRATISHISEVMRGVDKEARVLARDNKALKEEVTRLGLRVPSADLWDAQVSRLAAEAKAEEERLAAEEARIATKAKRDAAVTQLQAVVAQDGREIRAEESRAQQFSVIQPQYPYGQPGSTAHQERQAVLQAREDHVFGLDIAERLAAGSLTDEQAKDSWARRRAKRFHDESEAEIKEGKRKQANAANWKRSAQPGDPQRGDFMGFVDERGKIIKE